MSFYPEQINQHFLNPNNAGEIADANAKGSSASFVCGAALQIVLRIENEIICRATFKAAGCGFLFAAANVLCEKITGKTITQGVNVYELIENELGEFESPRKHCVELVWQTWQAAVNDFRQMKIEGWNGDDALICTCFGVSERTIENAIAENLLATVAEVTDICRAGGGCGSCQPLIQEILDDVWHKDF
jgi:NifU-like protein